MKNLLFVIAAVALVLAGCGKSEPSRSAIESVESLVASPERLKELRAQCKADHARVGSDLDRQCNAVAEATRRRFMSGGKSPYANDLVPSPAAPAPPAVGADSED